MTVNSKLLAIGLCLAMLSTSVLAKSPTRPYQMSILATTDSLYTASVDIPIFTQGVYTDQAQPAGRSIAWLPHDPNLDRHAIDWSRIDAVYTDEPYLELVRKNKSCTAPGVEEVRQALIATAAAVRIKAPKARFWVNFGQTEIEMMRDLGCPFNGDYIDVISMDIYHVDFKNSALSRLYGYVYENRATPHQQLALVAGTFTHLPGNPRKNTGDGKRQARRLSGFFKYAAEMNRRCDLPAGPVGTTGIYDGCPIWMVVGFTGGATPVPGAQEYLPIEHPNSRAVFNAWQTQFAIPRVDPTAHR